MFAVAEHEEQRHHREHQLGEIAADPTHDRGQFTGRLGEEALQGLAERLGIARPFSEPFLDTRPKQRQLGDERRQLRAREQRRDVTIDGQRLRLHQYHQPDDRQDDGDREQQRHHESGRIALPPEHAYQAGMQRPADIGEDRRPDDRDDERLQHLKGEHCQDRQQGGEDQSPQPLAFREGFHQRSGSEARTVIASNAQTTIESCRRSAR